MSDSMFGGGGLFLLFFQQIPFLLFLHSVSTVYKIQLYKTKLMNTIYPQFINDIHGQRSMVVLPIKDFDMIMEELEELEDIRLYDEAKNDGIAGYMLFSDYLQNRKRDG